MTDVVALFDELLDEVRVAELLAVRGGARAVDSLERVKQLAAEVQRRLGGVGRRRGLAEGAAPVAGSPAPRRAAPSRRKGTR